MKKQRIKTKQKNTQLVACMLHRSLLRSPRKSRPGSIMDVDEVFKRIGGFGRSQKTIYFLVNSIHIILGIHALALVFIAVEPNWTCEGSVPGVENLDKCLRFSQGNCSPDYSKDFTSIVSEVINLYGPACSPPQFLYNNLVVTEGGIRAGAVFKSEKFMTLNYPEIHSVYYYILRTSCMYSGDA